MFLGNPKQRLFKALWAKYYLEMGDQEIGDEDEGEPEMFTEVNLGDTPGGFKIYE